MVCERQANLHKTLSWLRSVKRAYGDEKAMEVWSEVSKILDDDELTIGVLHCLMRGGYAGHDIILTKWTSLGHPTYENGTKIPAIKTLRAWTGCGLKEAKDAVEAAEGIESHIKFKIARHHWFNTETEQEMEIPYEKMLRDFEEVGIEVEIE
jgi:hypothetical protein